MGECNRSYVAPRLGALLGSQIRLTEVQIEPAVNYDKPAHYTYLTTERKRIASNSKQPLGYLSSSFSAFLTRSLKPAFSSLSSTVFSSSSEEEGAFSTATPGSSSSSTDSTTGSGCF